MANGISCVYFAIRNYKKGQTERNIFKDGIAGVQTVRTVDAVAEGIKSTAALSGDMVRTASGSTTVLSKAANVAKKFVYPLVWLSGIFETIRSDDKVRTGVKNVCGISAMWGCEQVADKLLNKFCRVDDIKKLNGKAKALVPLLYLIRGSAFIAASLTGYSAGSKFGTGIVDKIRNKKTDKTENTDSKNTVEEKESKNLIDELKKKSDANKASGKIQNPDAYNMATKPINNNPGAENSQMPEKVDIKA